MFYCHSYCRMLTEHWTLWFICVCRIFRNYNKQIGHYLDVCGFSFAPSISNFPIVFFSSLHISRNCRHHLPSINDVFVTWSVQLRHPQPMQFQMVFSQKLINNICEPLLGLLLDSENCQLVKFIATASLITCLSRTESGRLGRRNWEPQVEESLHCPIVWPHFRFSHVVPRFTITQRRWFCFFVFVLSIKLCVCVFFLLAHALLRIGQLVEFCMVCEVWYDTFSAYVSVWLFPFRAFIEIWNAAQKTKDDKNREIC